MVQLVPIFFLNNMQPLNLVRLWSFIVGRDQYVDTQYTERAVLLGTPISIPEHRCTREEACFWLSDTTHIWKGNDNLVLFVNESSVLECLSAAVACGVYKCWIQAINLLTTRKMYSLFLWISAKQFSRLMGTHSEHPQWSDAVAFNNKSLRLSASLF